MYDAEAYFDETNRTIFLWEMTKKQAVVTKAFKETAKSHGWKFKIVNNIEKAHYPNILTPMIQPGSYRVTPESFKKESQNQT